MMKQRKEYSRNAIAVIAGTLAMLAVPALAIADGFEAEDYTADGETVELGTAAVGWGTYSAINGGRLISDVTALNEENEEGLPYGPTTLSSDGTGSVVDLSKVETVGAPRAGIGNFSIQATDGGLVDLSAARGLYLYYNEITASGGTIDLSSVESALELSVSAQEGGKVLLNSLGEIEMPSTTYISAKTGGEIQLGDTVNGVFPRFFVDNDSTIRVGSSTAAASDAGSIVVGSNGTFGAIGGGNFTGNLYSSGTLGIDGGADSVDLTGDFHQLAEGSVNIELSKNFNYRDNWNITGDAWLDGDLNISFLDDMTISAGDKWDVFTVDGTIYGQFANVNLLTGDNLDLVLDFSDPNVISIVAMADGVVGNPGGGTNPVPLPATFWLMGSGLAYLAGKRKMGKKGVAEQV